MCVFKQTVCSRNVYLKTVREENIDQERLYFSLAFSLDWKGAKQLGSVFWSSLSDKVCYDGSGSPSQLAGEGKVGPKHLEGAAAVTRSLSPPTRIPRCTTNALPGNSDITMPTSAPRSVPDLERHFSDPQLRMPKTGPQTAGEKEVCLPSCWVMWGSRRKWCHRGSYLKRETIWSSAQWQGVMGHLRMSWAWGLEDESPIPPGFWGDLQEAPFLEPQILQASAILFQDFLFW